MKINTGRKVRTDAKLERLEATQWDRLHVWFEENLRYSGVVRLGREEFGLRVGEGAVSMHWRRHILPQQNQDNAEIAAERWTVATFVQYAVSPAFGEVCEITLASHETNLPRLPGYSGSIRSCAEGLSVDELRLVGRSAEAGGHGGALR